MTVLHNDFESRGVLDLQKVGTYNYVRHSETKILMWAWAIDNGPVHLWEPHLGPMPAEALDALLDPNVIKKAWHANFERSLFAEKLDIIVPIEQWMDPMVNARYFSLPGSLEKVGEILKIPVNLRKDPAGDRLIDLFSIPRPQRKSRKQASDENTLFDISPINEMVPAYEFADYTTYPEEWAAFGGYCKQDVVAERAIGERLEHKQCAPLPEREKKLWFVDQKINAFGMPADRKFVENSYVLALRDKQALADQQKQLTGLENPNSSSQMLKWAQERGYPRNSLRKESVVAVLNDIANEVTDECRKVLELRKQSGKTSYTKLAALSLALSDDDYLRDQFLFMGSARAGRWCLAENSSISVKTPRGEIVEKPIQEVQLCDLVWDGESWVSHEGVVYSGDKEVITWDGIVATSEHVVWISGKKKLTLEEAKAKRLPLWRGVLFPYVIYRITSPSGKYYIGLTKSKLKERWRQHIKKARSGSEHPFYRSIRKYGDCAFTLEIIDRARDKKEAQDLEMYHISISPSFLLYNLSPGGEADGETGRRIFWERMNSNPIAKQEYLLKLSRIKLSNDWSNYEAMSIKGARWRKDNPREAYAISYRNIRIANRYKSKSELKDTRSRKEKLMWKYKRPDKSRENALDLWERRTQDEKDAVACKISLAIKNRMSLKSKEEKQSMMKNVRSHIDRYKQGRAASFGLKKYWSELKSDPIRYALRFANKRKSV